MRLPAHRTLTLGAALVAVLALTTSVPRAASAQPTGAPPAPAPVSLSGYADNNGVGVAPGDANVDGSGYGFPAAALPSGSATVDGIPYDLPTGTGAGQADNVVAAGQTIALPPGAYVRAYALATSTYGPAGGAATVHYADGTSSTAQLSRPTGTRAPARSPRRTGTVRTPPTSIPSPCTRFCCGWTRPGRRPR